MGICLRRREFAMLLGGAALWPLVARAQRRPVIGFLWSRSPGDEPQLVAAFREGLKEAGYIEGQNVVIEYRFADNQYDRLPLRITVWVESDEPNRPVLITIRKPPAPFAG